jgi:hypothetical protein
MQPIKFQNKQPSNTTLRGNVTGYSHPKCYAKCDLNCSSTISKEHFISESLLRQIELNNTAKIAGLSWQQRECFNIIPLSGLASKVLCERHNSALSPLDNEMGKFTQSIKDFDRATNPSSNDLTNETRFFCGEDIECWMLKCLIGASQSGNFRDTLIKPECIDLLFRRAEWPEEWGLYFPAPKENVVYHSDSFLVETFLNPTTREILAARFTIRGIPMDLILGRPDNPAMLGIWRPKQIVFKSIQVTKLLELSWQGNSSHQEVLLERVGTYDGPPNDWQDWEKNG